MDAIIEPPTLLLHPGAPEPPTANYVVAIDFGIRGGAKGTLVPLFLQPEDARRFLTGLGPKAAGLTPHTPSLAELAALLEDLRDQFGVTHADINPDRSNPNPTPIADVIHGLHTQP